ncbi:hypothetical protein HDU85_007441 [Gaertneriomyces sp. JEL0708]|nr:hypothetical protein HDU85_007441 [Gaertneriomyces sp. JEL0708]
MASLLGSFGFRSYSACTRATIVARSTLRPRSYGTTRVILKETSNSNIPDHVGSVGFYRKHILLASGQSSWPSHPEKADPFMKALADAAAPKDIKLSVCDIVPASDSSTSRTLVVLPENVRLPSVDQQMISRIVEDIAHAQPLGAPIEPLTSKMQILVCTHGSRDCRCGDIGTPVYQEFKKQIARKGLEHEIKVNAVSHIGGHKYAGNAIVYPSGDWYGMLQPEDVSDLVETLSKDKIMWPKWRGRMGLSKHEQVEQFMRATQSAADGASAPKSIRVSFILPDDTTQEFEVPLGKKLMEVGKENEIDNIEGTCGGNLECATCHVIVDPKYADKVPKITEEEEDMLDYAVGRTPQSRLSCQLVATPELNNIRLIVPTVVPRPFPAQDSRASWHPNVKVPPRQQARGYSTSSSNNSGSDTPRDFKTLTREYGPIALCVYLTISFMTTCACFAAITLLGIDEKQIKSVFNTIKSFLGFPPPPELAVTSPAGEEEPSDAGKSWTQWMPEWMRNPTTQKTLTNILLAMAMAKLFVPIKVPLAAYLTPGVARRLRSFGFDLGRKGGYKSAANKVKTEVKGRADKFKAERKRRREEDD